MHPLFSPHSSPLLPVPWMRFHTALVNWHNQQAIYSLDFHPSGRIATGGADRLVKVRTVIVPLAEWTLVPLTRSYAERRPLGGKCRPPLALDPSASLSPSTPHPPSDMEVEPRAIQGGLPRDAERPCGARARRALLARWCALSSRPPFSLIFSRNASSDDMRRRLLETVAA